MLSCREVTERANDFHDGHMGWPEQIQFRVHLLMCRHCSRYLEQLGNTIRLVRAMPSEQPEPEVEQQLESAFRAQLGKDPGHGQPS